MTNFRFPHEIPDLQSKEERRQWDMRRKEEEEEEEPDPVPEHQQGEPCHLCINIVVIFIVFVLSVMTIAFPPLLLAWIILYWTCFGGDSGSNP